MSAPLKWVDGLFHVLREALERAGVDKERVHGPDRFGWFLVNREDPDRWLTFGPDVTYSGELVWSWGVYEVVGLEPPALVLVEHHFLSTGQEPDLPSMVAKVVEFLSKEES